MSKRTWCVMDLVVGVDGKLVLTKVQAACFHMLLFLTVGFITFIERKFIDSMWALYAAVAVGHAVVDKTAAQVNAFKNKQLDHSAPAAPPATTDGAAGR